MVLLGFIVIIETTRLLIRPITLSVRLAANITAGHLILGLISITGLSAIGYFTQILILILEILVSFIQAYVFKLLLILYLKEGA